MNVSYLVTQSVQEASSVPADDALRIAAAALFLALIVLPWVIVVLGTLMPRTKPESRCDCGGVDAGQPSRA